MPETPELAPHIISAPWCFKCRRPLNMVKRHETPFGDQKVATPLCENCWRHAHTPKERLPFYRMLWKTWRGPWIAELDSEWRAMRRAVMDGL